MFYTLTSLPEHRSNPEIICKVKENYPNADIPLSGAYVKVQEAGFEETYTTSDDGIVNISNELFEPEQQITLFVTCDNYVSQSIPVTLRGGQQYIEIALDRSTDVGLTIPSVGLHIYDEELLSALEGVSVELQNKSTSEVQTRTTGSAGGCNFNNIVEGDYTVTLSKQYYEPVTADVTLRVNRHNLVYYLLNHIIPQVSIRCIDESSRRALPGVSVSITLDEGNYTNQNTNDIDDYVDSSSTDENGYVYFENVPEGDYDITCTNEYIEDYYGDYYFTKLHHDCEIRYHQIILPSAEVIVVDDNLGTPLYNANVKLSIDEVTKYEGQTSETGTFIMTNVPIADYDVNVSCQYYYDGNYNGLRFDVLNPVHTIRLKDTRISEVRVRCLVNSNKASERKPIPDVTLSLSAPGMETQEEVTGTDGIVKFHHLEEGKVYTISTLSDLFKEYTNTISFDKKTAYYDILLEQDVIPSGTITVKDDVTSEPVPNALVFGIMMADPSIKLEGTTDDNGQISFENITIGNYNFVVSAEHHDNKEQEMVFDTKRSTYTVLIHNQYIPTSTFTVKDRIYLKPCKTVDVQIKPNSDPEATPLTTTTDDTGKCSFHDLPEGDYDVYINNSFYGEYNETISLSQARPDKTLEVPWHYVNTLRFIINSTDNRFKVQGGSVSIKDGEIGNTIKANITEQIGSAIAEFESVRCSHYNLKIDTEDEHFKIKETSFDLLYQDLMELTVELEPDLIPQSNVTVKDISSNVPIPEVNIKLIDKYDNEVSGRTGKDGKGTILDVPVGKYDIDLEGGYLDD